MSNEMRAPWRIRAEQVAPMRVGSEPVQFATPETSRNKRFRRNVMVSADGVIWPNSGTTPTRDSPIRPARNIAKNMAAPFRRKRRQALWSLRGLQEVIFFLA
jgi:hypothetical protein